MLTDGDSNFQGKSNENRRGTFLEARGCWLGNLVHLQAIINYECAAGKISPRFIQFIPDK